MTERARALAAIKARNARKPAPRPNPREMAASLAAAALASSKRPEGR